MAEVTARQRVIALVLYTIILMVVHYFVVQPSFLPSEKVLWLFTRGCESPLWQPVAEPALYTARRRGDQWLPAVILAMLAASSTVTPALKCIARQLWWS